MPYEQRPCGNAASLLPKARNYLIGIAVGLPAMNAMKILTDYMPLDNDRNLPVISSIVLTAADIAMDLPAVFCAAWRYTGDGARYQHQLLLRCSGIVDAFFRLKFGCILKNSNNGGADE